MKWMNVGVICVVVFGMATGAGTCLGAQTVGPRILRGTVHVEVFGPFGEKVPMKDITLFRLLPHDKGRDSVHPGQNLVATDVPYGYYDLTIADRGGGMAEEAVTVNTAEVWVRLGLHFPAGDALGPPGALVIVGEIRPKIGGDNWWARAEGVFLPERRESPISKDGKFRLGGLQMGTYLVEVFDGSRLRHVDTVEIDPKQPYTQLFISIPR